MQFNPITDAGALARSADAALQRLRSLPRFDGAWTSLTGRPSFATVATSGSYADLTGTPTIQAIQRTRAQSDTAGVLIWTFPVAYAGGVTPVVSVAVEDATAATWNVQITAISNTSVTVQLAKNTVTSILGVSVVSVAATPQAFVHLTAVAP